MWLALLPFAWPIAKRVLVALGIGIISFVGCDAVFDESIGYVNTAFEGLAPDVLAYVTLGGLLSALKSIFGAYATVFSFQAVKRFGFL